MKNGGAVCPVCGSDDVTNIWLYSEGLADKQPEGQDTDKLLMSAPYFCRKCRTDFVAVFELKYLEARDIEPRVIAKEKD
jgi:hypothetical protein